MKLCGVPVLVLLFSMGAASGQQTQPLAAQSTANPQAPSSRSSYDPMARGEGTVQPKGIVETTLAGINPQNKDYGTVVADWRKDVFDTAVNRIYLWSIVILCLVLSVSLLGNVWLLRQRQRRLAISANIVVQLFNAYVGSRAKALEVIGKYNALVERYNRLNDDMNTAISEEPGDSDEKAQHSKVDYSRARQDKGTAPSGSTAVATAPAASGVEADREVSEFEALRSQVQEYETKLQRKDAQLQAKDNQITNLRGRLTRAHDSLEGERLQKSGAK
jgi:hypothetical protein